MLGKHNEAEGALSKWPNRLVLVNATLRIKTLGPEDLVVPVLLGFLGLEVDGPLLLGRTDQQEAVLGLGLTLLVFGGCDSTLFVFKILRVIGVCTQVLSLRSLRCISGDTLERAQLVANSGLLGALGAIEYQVRVIQNQLVHFQAI